MHICPDPAGTSPWKMKPMQKRFKPKFFLMTSRGRLYFLTIFKLIHFNIFFRPIHFKTSLSLWVLTCCYVCMLEPVVGRGGRYPSECLTLKLYIYERKITNLALFTIQSIWTNIEHKLQNVLTQKMALLQHFQRVLIFSKLIDHFLILFIIPWWLQK